jgi:DNA polymerase III delta subunit
MVKQLSPRALKKLLEMGGDLAQRRQFLLNASQGMTVEAVMDLVQAAATDSKQTISHSMMRLFSKLSKYAENDAEKLRDALVSLGNFANDRVVILRDPDAAEVRATLRDVARTAKSSGEDTLVVFYYSGHADDTQLH